MKFQPINILDFLKEIFTRLGQKSPTFFKILQWVLTICGAVSGIPALLEMFQIVLPEPFASLSSKGASIAFFVGTFLMGLPVENTTKVAEENPKVLPFTSNTKAVVEEIQNRNDSN